MDRIASGFITKLRLYVSRKLTLFIITSSLGWGWKCFNDDLSFQFLYKTFSNFFSFLNLLAYCSVRDFALWSRKFVLCVLNSGFMFPWWILTIYINFAANNVLTCGVLVYNWYFALLTWFMVVKKSSRSVKKYKKKQENAFQPAAHPNADKLSPLVFETGHAWCNCRRGAMGSTILKLGHIANNATQQFPVQNLCPLNLSTIASH